MIRRLVAPLAALLAIALPSSVLPALAGATPSPAGAAVYFIGLENGARVKSPLLVRFGLSGMGIAPAGVEKEATGHHHLLIDTPLTPTDLAYAVPADATHVHFGKGQTEASLTLSPGKHTLQLVLADHGHVPHDPPVASAVVTIEVMP